MPTVPAIPIGQQPRRRRAFTVAEMLFAVSVALILITLLVVGLGKALRAAKGAADTVSLSSIRTGVDAFRNEFGFAPPLVKDKTPTRIEKGETVIDVYQIGGTDQDVTEDRKFLKQRPNTPAPNGWGTETKYFDPRYSEYSLAYYVVGALETKPLSGAQVPIDGVVGSGLLKPRTDGTFDVPEDLKRGKTSDSSVRTGRVYQPFIDTTKAAATLFRDGTDTSGSTIELRDRNGVPIRFYRWIHGDEQERVRSPEDFNVPLILGNPTTDPALRDATFAIVSAGADGAFGDETLALLASRLGVSEDDLSATTEAERNARDRAMKDNIVEVGS